MAVDVGHHYGAPGVTSAGGIAEIEFNLALAYEVREALHAAGLAVRLIGERGGHAVLAERTRDAAGADLFVSLHHDGVQPQHLPAAERFSGYSLFVSRRNPQLARSLACASAIGSEMRAAGFRPSRYHAEPVAGDNRPFADEENGVHFYDSLAVGRTAPMPSVLVEAGVIVNAAEEARMRDAGVRRRIAQAIARGVQACLR